MSDINLPLGWVDNPQAVHELIQERSERGDAVMGATFTAKHDNQLPGTWERMKARGLRGVFLRDRELIATGKGNAKGTYRRPFLQRSGTCVARGMCRGVQVSLDVSIVDNSQLLLPVEISFAPIYTLARHEVGKDRCGYDDGAILADAARAVHDYGVATTAAILAGNSEDFIEKQAVKYAAPGVGTPMDWITATRGHTCQTFWPETLDLLFDCLAAGYAVPYAMNYITGQPNKNGISGLGSWGPHCRCFTGVFVDEHGETQLESSESWGRFPADRPMDIDQTCPIDQIPRITLRYADGIEKKLAPGSVGVDAKAFWGQIHSGGEAWAVSAPKFESQSIAEILKARSLV